MNNESIKVRIKWIIPRELFEKVEQLEMCYICFDMDRVVVSEFTEGDCNYDIVIDALSDTSRITVSEQFLQSLDVRHLRYFIRGIKSQITRLGLLTQFVPEIRKLYTYAMDHFPDEEMKFKLYYATIGEYKYINRQSIKYLREYIAHYEDNTIYDDRRALTYYLLAMAEEDPISSEKLFRKSLGLFEVSRLDDYFPYETYASEHALCLIEWADILSANRSVLNEYRENKKSPCKLPYEKAIEIMKTYIKYEVLEMDRFEGKQKQEYENFVKGLADNIDSRLKESRFASSYCGILPKYCEELLIPKV